MSHVLKTLEEKLKSLENAQFNIEDNIKLFSGELIKMQMLKQENEDAQTEIRKAIENLGEKK